MKKEKMENQEPENQNLGGETIPETISENLEAPSFQKPVKSLTEKRGRKSNEQKELEDKVKKLEEQQATAFSGLVGIPFNILAARLGEHWKLNEKEKNDLADGVKGVLDRYLPALFTTNPELAILAFTLGGIILPRAIETNELIKLAKQREQIDAETQRQKL